MSHRISLKGFLFPSGKRKLFDRDLTPKGHIVSHDDDTQKVQRGERVTAKGAEGRTSALRSVCNFMEAGP